MALPTNKYLRTLPNGAGVIDVYDVLLAFAVTDPGLQHAIKKQLCVGIRGHKDEVQDLMEARQALDRAIEFAIHRKNNA